MCGSGKYQDMNEIDIELFDLLTYVRNSEHEMQIFQRSNVNIDRGPGKIVS